MPAKLWNGAKMTEAAAVDAEWLERGRRLFAGPCDFVKGVTNLAQLPDIDRAEIAFAGRSNVGKSSLINALTGRSRLARSSNTPGRTRELNYFNLGEQLWLVDMPGYGYAEAPKTEIAKWSELVGLYLRGRPTLLRVMLLIDARHGVKPNDLEVMKLMNRSAVVYQLVLTKCDKLRSEAALQQVLAEVESATEKQPAKFPQIVLTSSDGGRGINELRAIVAALIPPK